mmetsp:Transcript_1378/g.2984  ORF Transcript_1378/g.2984 Transcript_1378/m.2984 type:complete len:274 (-) Transcript_1378:2534-3355(-)
MRPAARSDIVTSHGWKPARRKAEHISRSPLEPSSRRMATFGEAAVICHSGWGAGILAWMKGVLRVFMLSRSCLTHSGFACSSSSANDVDSQQSRSTVIFSSYSTSPLLPMIETLSVLHGAPISTQSTPALAYAALTSSTNWPATSITRPSSSWKSASSVETPATLDTSSDTPQLPANAISSTDDARPPSERSWPAEILRAPMSSCVTLKAALSCFATSVSQSAGTSPSLPYTCANTEPPMRHLDPAGCTTRILAPGGDLRSGVTVSVTSGQPT